MNPDDMPTCSTCGDVVIYCTCIEKIMEENRRKNGIPMGKVENDFFNELSVEYDIQL